MLRLSLSVSILIGVLEDSERFSARSVSEYRLLFVDVLEELRVENDISLVHFAVLDLLLRAALHLLSQEALVVLHEQSSDLVSLFFAGVVAFLHLLFNVQIVFLLGILHVEFKLILLHLLEEEVTIAHCSFLPLKRHSVHLLCDCLVTLVVRLLEGFF